MGKRKRFKAEKIDLSYIQVKQPEYIEEYDPDEDTLGGLNLEEAEDMGGISIPKPIKIISTGGYYNED